MEFKIGQIVFFNWNNPYMKLIRLFNLVRYKDLGWAHCGVITKVDDETVQIHEALSSGFVKSDYPIEFMMGVIEQGICAIAETETELIDVEENADKYLGRGYGWFDIFGIFASLVLKWKFIKITGASKLICSEAVARILYDSSNKEIDFEAEYDKPYDLITPMDIYLSKQVKVAENGSESVLSTSE